MSLLNWLQTRGSVVDNRRIVNAIKVFLPASIAEYRNDADQLVM